MPAHRLALLAALVACAPPEPPPMPALDRPVPTSSPIHPLAAAAARADKLLVLVPKATWCPPCATLERTMTTDPPLVAFLAEHAHLVTFDVDADPRLAADAQVRGLLPQVVVYRDGQQFDRLLTLRDATTLLRWLSGARAGRRAGESPPAPGSPRVLVDEVQHARTLWARGDLAGARTAYVGVWQAADQLPPAERDELRYSELVPELAHLIAADPSAAPALLQLPAMQRGRLRRLVRRIQR